MSTIEAFLRYSGISPPENQGWADQELISVESYYAQAPKHFEVEGAGLCRTAKGMSQGLSSTRNTMQPQQFSCKPKGQRIVVLGGSSVQGYGLTAEKTFPSQLEQKIQTRYPNIDVINAGVAGYNTLQIRRMLPEVWDLKPDILVIYSGHNDYVFYPVIEQLLNDNPTFHLIRNLGDNLAIWRSIRHLLRKTNIISRPVAPPPPREKPDFNKQASAAFNQIALPRPETPNEVEQLLEQQTAADKTIRHFFRANIEEINNQANVRGVELVLIAPVSRLDSPPVDGIHWSKMNQTELDLFWTLWSEVESTPPPYESPIWTELLDLSPQYAPLAHAYAQAAWTANEKQIAQQYWRIAQDNAPPSRSIRAGTKMIEWSIETGQKLNIETINPNKPFQEAAKIKGIPAGTLFLDALHLTEKGADLMSQLTFQKLEKEAWILSANSLE